MPVMTRRPRDGGSQPPRYKLVLALANGAEPRALAFATDAEHASVTFHTLLQQLRRDGHCGELQVCDLQDKERVVMSMRLQCRSDAAALADDDAA
jgi:hypothetical protein